MPTEPIKLAVMTGLTLALSLPAGADTATEAYQAMGVKPAQVLAGTALTAQVIPGGDKEVVAVTTYLTGKREKAEAVNVRLDVFGRQEDKLYSLYTRDFGAELGGNLGDGDLQVVDLDGDGVNEVIASFKSFADPLIEQRLAEVILYERSGFRTAWSGPLDYDATKDARGVPPERRDRFHREIDVSSTLRARGEKLFIQKRMIAVAGERLADPKVVQEEFPLRAR